MTFGLILTGAALLALPGLSPWMLRQLAPSEFVRLTVHSLWLGMALIASGLALLALPVTLGPEGANIVGAEAESVLEHVAPGHSVLGWFGVAGAVFMAARAIAALLAVKRLRRVASAALNERRCRYFEGRSVVILPTSNVVAFSAAGRNRTIVLSDGLVEALPSDQLAAIIRHESAHLDHRHERYLSLAHLADRCIAPLFPLTYRTTALLRLSVERWADEHAAAGAPRARSSVLAAVQSLFTWGDANQSRPDIDERLRALSVVPVRATARNRIRAYVPLAGCSATGLGFASDGFMHAAVIAAASVPLP